MAHHLEKAHVSGGAAQLSGDLAACLFIPVQQGMNVDNGDLLKSC
jgi:hypothetical protein